jgi:fatty acid desaturase
MKEQKTVVNNNGVGFATLLTLVFIVLKLTGYIAWSWWWVLSPLWISAIAWVLLVVGVAVMIAKSK